MQGRRNNPRRLLARSFVLAGFLASGCAFGPGGQAGFCPTNGLLESAKAVRQPEPLPLPRELDKHPLPTYTVEPGDVLLVHAADLDSPVRLPGDQPVLPDGTINLGRYGQLLVVGQTIEAIQAMVQAAVNAQTKDAGYIAVRLVTRQSKVFYVLGEVNAPAAYPLSGRETVLDALVAAGGLTDRGSRRNIILTRPTAPDCPRLVLPVCLREIVQLGDTTTNYQLAPGDRIFVPTRTLWEDCCWKLGRDCFSCGGPATRAPACGAPKSEAVPSPQ